MIVLVPHPHVRVDRNILGGSPHVAGTRVAVRSIYLLYREGRQPEQIQKNYQKLSMAQVLDALSFALDNPEVIEEDVQRVKALEHRVMDVVEEAGLAGSKKA